VRTETTPAPTMSYVVHHAPSQPAAIEPDISHGELPARSSDPHAEHDATLLVAALEHLEAQRAAIEWLLDADLLCLCLV
jgi:hypothetical protein